MQVVHCHFSMDEPIGSFSPVQGVNAAKLLSPNKLVKCLEFGVPPGVKFASKFIILCTISSSLCSTERIPVLPLPKPYTINENYIDARTRRRLTDGDVLTKYDRGKICASIFEHVSLRYNIQ